MLDRLSEIRAFQAVADTGGFTAAAKQLRISQSLVSRAVARLERRLGTTLLRRSTRRLSLTDEGAIFLDGCRRVLEDIADAERSVRPGGEVMGTLRVSASILFGQDPLVPLLPEFLARYPKLDLHLVLSDRPLDLIEQNIDVAIRLGRLTDSSLVARKLGDLYRVVVTAPSYIAQHGMPDVPDDLLKHNCLLYDETLDHLNRWPFLENGKLRHIKVRGRAMLNTPQSIEQLVQIGFGIARMRKHRALSLIRLGQLAPLLEDFWHDDATPVHALYLKTAITRPKVRAFVDFLIEKLAVEPAGDAAGRPGKRRPKPANERPPISAIGAGPLNRETTGQR